MNADEKLDAIRSYVTQIEIWLAHPPKSPIGALHGAGMVDAYKAVARDLKEILEK